MYPIYYYPNRPILIPPDPLNPTDPSSDYLDSLENSGKYAAEQKFNEDNCQIYTDEFMPPVFWNRTHARLGYRPIPQILEELKIFPPNSVINAELMHNHTKTVKNKLIVHCVMVWKNKPLLGKTWGDSRKILEDLDWRMNDHVILSKIQYNEFWELFQKADGNVTEGIILKDPLGKLLYSTTPINNVSWMLKIRKPCKKYSF